ncbi:MAG TPA: hypothetical protein PLB05_00050 [Candidatus Omnitrophota bacterium]|nr:hypothetical protein [Candidatus Omnitrophota bacterium]HPN56222.1 hypothetical protein [Candidatus Omnitrophota bacterium]
MPFYHYFCPTNGKTIEVRHPMDVRLGTWAAVCLLAQIEPGGTLGNAPVQRLVSRAVPTVPRCRYWDKDKPSETLEL